MHVCLSVCVCVCVCECVWNIVALSEALREHLSDCECLQEEPGWTRWDGLWLPSVAPSDRWDVHSAAGVCASTKLIYKL